MAKRSVPRRPNWGKLAAVPESHRFMLELSIEFCIDAMASFGKPITDVEADRLTLRRAEIIAIEEGVDATDIALVNGLVGSGIKGATRSLWLELSTLAVMLRDDARLAKYARAIEDWRDSWGEDARAKAALSKLQRLLDDREPVTDGPERVPHMHRLGVRLLSDLAEEVARG